MKRRSKIILGAVALLSVAGALAVLRASNRGGDADVKTVVDRALAVGRIEPDVEISVKSQLSGVVRRRFADVGEFVRAGAPLLEIKPQPTPQELVEAKREMELREVELATLEREIGRQEDLLAQNLVSQREYDDTQQRYAQTKIQLLMAREQLQLLQDGKLSVASDSISTVIRSPIDGFILEKMVDVGDPVVPLTSFQEGTVLMSMAGMEHLLFRGTVDEIDVGKLKEGMPADIKIGALPQAKITGVVSQISLKARTEENSTVFPVEIDLTSTEGATLRVGYSANADVIIDRRDSVLVIPERLVEFAGDTARVTLLRDDGTQDTVTVETGLSDAISVEVVEGLRAGDRVVEPPPREIS
jgi:HlyD family secretion protein